jgi:hypothetical protein
MSETTVLVTDLRLMFPLKSPDINICVLKTSRHLERLDRNKNQTVLLLCCVILKRVLTVNTPRDIPRLAAACLSAALRHVSMLERVPSFTPFQPTAGRCYGNACKLSDRREFIELAVIAFIGLVTARHPFSGAFDKHEQSQFVIYGERFLLVLALPFIPLRASCVRSRRTTFVIRTAGRKLHHLTARPSTSTSSFQLPSLSPDR